MEICTVGVVGCGTMGAGIIELCSAASVPVVAIGRTPASLKRGRARVRAVTERKLAKAKITEAQALAQAQLVTYSTDFGYLGQCDLVIEAVAETEKDKIPVLGEIDREVAAQGVAIASTTSGIPISRLALATSRPERVLGAHFFNPVGSMALVEIIAGERTLDEVIASASAFMSERLGKTVINAPDRPGFIVNALLIPYLLSAVRMLEGGLTCSEVIDAGMMLGCAHPMGPLSLCDLIGLDVVLEVALALHRETQADALRPPKLLEQMVDSGKLGRKSGSGFFSYQG